MYLTHKNTKTSTIVYKKYGMLYGKQGALVNEWGFKNKVKWALFESAPLTGSGLNEVIATAEYKSDLLALAKARKIKVTESGRYQIIKIKVVTDKCTVCGHSYDETCSADLKHPGHSYCGRKKDL